MAAPQISFIPNDSTSDKIVISADQAAKLCSVLKVLAKRELFLFPNGTVDNDANLTQAITNGNFYLNPEASIMVLGNDDVEPRQPGMVDKNFTNLPEDEDQQFWAKRYKGTFATHEVRWSEAIDILKIIFEPPAVESSDADWDGSDDETSTMSKSEKIKRAKNIVPTEGPFFENKVILLNLQN